MRNINIDQTHSRAIAREIGERLRGLLREETELPSSLKRRMQKLRELDETPSIVPSGNERFSSEDNSVIVPF
ncbi:hypothetical protein [Bradyrhizobium zhanjiangense]|uniref:Uncharacterized protein n=1 Tax=Bradyrhizobium zhanjiangense TaxID=1325107 RepID=A0A4Q0SSK6_9BRAD|nr:hypothetical protein [Bradyrhizobium zhanjiangense]RXH40946.1 hypothetical protein XH94_10865 [Bradyrhizobium zhanjiangense]